MTRTPPAPVAAPSWLSARGAALALLASVLLSWPMLLVTAPMGYFDTISYHDSGRKVLIRLAEVVGMVPETPVPDASGDALAAPVPASDAVPAPHALAPPGEEGGRDAGEVRILRSFPYSVFLYLTSLSPLGLVATTILQTAATLLMLLPLLPPPGGLPARPWRIGAGLLLVGGLSTLPWVASYAMPDILAAALVLYAALLVGPIEGLGRGWQAALTLIACFAVASHYGHIPLAAGLLLVVAVLRARARGRRALWPLALAALPVAAALALNLAGSAAALGGASLAPKRLPILLARSVADGPGWRYLEEACPGAGYAICEAMPAIPDDLGGFLWSKQGLGGLTVAQLDAVRAEEPLLLWRIFRAYPGEQAWAFLGNAALQVVQVGTGEIQPLSPIDTPEGPSFMTISTEAAATLPALAAFDLVTKVGTALGALLLLAALLRGGLGRQDRDVVIVCVAGLLGNALIFGGLSAPVDRYQSRLAWLLPALGIILWLRRPAQPAPAS